VKQLGNVLRIISIQTGIGRRTQSAFSRGVIQLQVTVDRRIFQCLITTGLATAAGVSGLGVAAALAERYGLVLPDHGGIFGVGETLTYAAQRILMSRHSLAREVQSQ
jgi:hypothetical protein